MLVATDLSKRFGGFLAVNRVSFEVREGEIVGLIGPNGSGKSTTFNLIAGTLRPTAGAIRFRDEDITGLPAHAICHRGIARTFQIPRPFRKLSLIDNVTLAAYYGEAGRIGREEARGRAEEALDLVGLTSGKPPRRGSGPPRSRSWNWRALSLRGRSCSWPTKAWAASTRPRWSAPPICSRASATAWASRSFGSSTTWVC